MKTNLVAQSTSQSHSTSTINKPIENVTKIPMHNEWWEIVICLGSQIGNISRHVLFWQRNIRYGGISIPEVILEWISLLLAAWIFADFISGLYHWFADSYRTSNPIINEMVFDYFQLHHDKPNLICQRPICNINREVCTPAFVFSLYTMFWMPDGVVSKGTLFFSFFVAWISLTNQAHRWSHQATGVPHVVKLLQKAGVLLSPQKHRLHHYQNHVQDYCITSGICNPILNRVDFWRFLEAAVYWALGAKSYAMLVEDPKAWAQSPFNSLRK